MRTRLHQRSRLILVRHGSAPSEWATRGDPDLNARGRRQARLACAGLQRLGPMPILSSPLKRAVQTATPIAERWGVPIRIDPVLRDIEPPSGVTPPEAWSWLERLTQETWDESPGEVRALRDEIIRLASELRGDTLLVTHMFTISVLLGHASGGEETMPFWPDNCSISIVETGDRWRLVRVGRQIAAARRSFAPSEPRR